MLTKRDIYEVIRRTIARLKEMDNDLAGEPDDLDLWLYVEDLECVGENLVLERGKLESLYDEG